MHDILNIMTRSMNKSKKTDVPVIYPLKGEHKIPEHVKPPQEVQNETAVEQIEQEPVDHTEPADMPDVIDVP